LAPLVSALPMRAAIEKGLYLVSDGTHDNVRLVCAMLHD
jgi:hypothetical protein